MKSTLLSVTFLIFSFSAIAQSWEWGRKAGDNGGSTSPSSVVTDLAGNAYVAGYLTADSVVFGDVTLHYAASPSLNVANGNFFVKYDSSGNVVWAKNVNNWPYGYVPELAIDRFGNLYMTGGTSRPFFLAKYNSNGDTVWTLRVANAAYPGGAAEPTSISTDSEGNIYIAGWFYGTRVVVGVDTLGHSPGDAMFVVKCDSSGHILWARKNFNATSSIRYGSVCAAGADLAGNVYVGGRFANGRFSFGTDTLGSSFFAKYDASGNLQWAKSFPGPNYAISSVNADVAGNVVFAGWFTDSLKLGAVTFINSIPPDSTFGNNYKQFIAKCDPSGNVMWANTAGGTSSNMASYFAATDTAGNIYMTGSYNASMLGNSLTIDTFTFSNTGYRNFLFVKYSSDGKMLWAKSANGTVNNYANGVTADVTGRYLYVFGGFFDPSLTFGSDVLDCVIPSYPDAFLARFNQPGTLPPPPDSNFTQAIFIGPNPATSELTITSTVQPINDVVIIDIWGQIIYHLEPHANTQAVDIDVRWLPAAMYFVRVNSTSCRKFVKQ